MNTERLLIQRHNGCKLIKRAVQLGNDPEIPYDDQTSKEVLGLIYRGLSILDGIINRPGYTYIRCPYCADAFAEYGWLWPEEALKID